MAMLEYSLSLNKTNWTDISGLINSKNTSITHNLCTQEFKSAVDTASIQLIPSANLELWSDTLAILLNEDNIYAKIATEEGIIFFGVVDKSSLSIETKRIPSSCSITLNDVSTIYIDKKPTTHSAYRNKKISEIVKGLLTEIGFSYTSSKIVLDEADDTKLEAFIVDPDDSDDYRTMIDNLLFESGGYVLNTTENGTAEIVKIEWKNDSSDPKRIIQSQTLSSAGIKTTANILDEDGVDLTYYSLAYSEADQAVYVGVTSLSKTDTGLTGEDVANGQYFPADGDLEATYEEYDDSLLDRAYNTKVSRKANDDLAIVDVTDAYLSLRAYGYNADGTINPTLLDNDKAFDFPVLTSLGMTTNPLYYSTKAWILLKNKYGKKVSINEFTIRGKTLYKKRKNRVLLPNTSKNPEEYEAKTIYTQARADNFAQFYWHFKKYSRYISTWKENSWGTLGELVVVNHRDTEFAQTALVVSKTITFIRPDYPQVSLTGVAIGEWNEYDSKTWGSNSNKRNPITSIVSYYIAENYKVKPTSADSRWQITMPDDLGDNKRFLWKKDIVTYQNEKTTEDINLNMVYGDKGEAGSYLSFNVSQTQIDCYADGSPVSEEKIVFTANSDLFLTLYIRGISKKSASQNLTYEDTPSGVLDSFDSVVATVKAGDGTLQQSYTISKVKRTGVLTLSADKQSIAYYADDVPHDSTETVTLTINAENYKTYPKLYLNGEEVTIEQSYSQTYTFKPSEKFGASDTITAKVAIGTASQTVVISKLKDVGSLSISSSLTVFDYYADNVPVNTANNAVLTISQQGYSEMPKLYLNGGETAYSSGTYSISPTACQNVLSILAEVKNDYESKSVTITKVKQQPNIAVSASVGAVEYYYDGVNISDDIEVSVSYSGLFYAPLCRVGDKAIILDTQGKGTLPISWFDSVEGGLVVTAYAQKNIVCESSLNIPKNKYPLILQLKADSTQFSYDSNNDVAPESITIENGTTGLSDKNLVNLVVGGEAKTWADGKFIVTPDMITGRYLAISIGYGTESQSMLITKTYDGRWEEVEYAKTKSFTIYPGDDYTFVYNSDGLVYNGETILWASRWTKTQPDISSIEYLWRRARKDSSEEWQYTRLTGVKGTDGKSAGMYLGHYLEAPTTRSDGTAIENGDFYLNTSEEGAPLVYKYVSDSNQWQLVTTSDSNWSQIASDVMNDVNDYGGALLSTSAFYGFFQLLSAQKAFIKSLGAQEITLNDGGAIQSNNYETSGGAEGFKIDSDGRADFSEGTWRGSFANGLSFIPETNLTIKKTMTHKEVYQAMKKAGIVEGVYKTADVLTFINDGTAHGSTKPVAHYGNSEENGGCGLSILEYGNGNLSCSIPLVAPGSTGLIPLTKDIYLMFEIKTTTTNNEKTITSKNAYLVNKSMLARATRTCSAESLHTYPVDISSWYILGFLDSSDDNETVAMYGVVLNGKFMVQTGSNVFSVYTLNEESMSLTLTGTASIPDGWYIPRWIFPTYYFHKQTTGGYIVTMLNSTYTQFKFFTTTDLINYTESGTAYSVTLPTGATICMPFDIIKVGDRIFAQILEYWNASATGRTDELYRYYFAEYNTTTQKFEQIPDEYTCVEEIKSINIVPLCEKNGIIVGSFSGYDLFTYNTTTNVFTDLSKIFYAAMPYLTYPDDDVLCSMYTVQARKRCFRSDNADADSKKWSSCLYNPNINITAIQWSLKYSCFLISAKIILSMSVFVVYKYYPATGKAELMSPVVVGDINIPNISPFVEDALGNYALTAGNYILMNYLSTTEFQPVEFNNVSMEDFIKYGNGDKTLSALLGVADTSNLPYCLQSEMMSILKEFTLSDGYLPSTKNDLHFFKTADTRIKINAPFPYEKIKKVAIREDADSYKIVLLDALYIYYYSFPFNICGVSSASYLLDTITLYLHANGKDIEPILTIDKDSTEQLGVSFYWDFPAQLTVKEGLKKLVRADLFRDDIRFK